MPTRSPRSAPWALLLLTAAAPALAHQAPAARIAALVGSAPGSPFSPLPPLAAVVVPSPPSNPAGVGERLPAPDAALAAWLTARVPGLDAASVRVMDAATADGLLGDAVARGLSPLEFFTEPVFRGGDAFYIPHDLLDEVFRRYDIPVLTPATGVSSNGIRFRMRGLLIGQGRIEALYDWGPFSFANPEFGGDTYTLAARVTQRIRGPGDLAVSGIAVRIGAFYPEILRIVKTGPGRVRVDTTLGSREQPITPIVRR